MLRDRHEIDKFFIEIQDLTNEMDRTSHEA